MNEVKAMVPKYIEIMGDDYIDHVTCIRDMVKFAMTKNSNDLLSSVSNIGSMGVNSIITLSILTGVPVGILAHIVDKNITKKKSYEKELIMEAQKYKEAAKALELEMARQKMKVV